MLSGFIRRTYCRGCHLPSSLENNRFAGAASKSIEKRLVWTLEQVLFQFFPLKLPPLYTFLSLMLFGTRPVWRISANPGFSKSQAKQGIKLICLSAALRTSSLSLRNHTDHNLSIYLAFSFPLKGLVSQGTLGMDLLTSLP